ncbi:MAG: C40 family peptidase [Burkholderiales bacterium]|nr:C40 family peptidase [Burkholderiales bacterium]
MKNTDFPQRALSFFCLRRKIILSLFTLSLLSACGSSPKERKNAEKKRFHDLPPTERGHEVVIFAFSLLDIGYRFGGKNPQAGFDCSGMVTYIFEHAVGVKVSGNAADIARQGEPIPLDGLRPGDLVFFNTSNRSFSHTGIYIGNGKFIHAPSTNGKVRVDSLDSGYFAPRYEAARRYF